MQTLRTIEFFSGTLPSGETVTLFMGNERAFDDADAAYLLAAYPERFERVTAENAPGLSVDNAAEDATEDAAPRKAKGSKK